MVHLCCTVALCLYNFVSRTLLRLLRLQPPRLATRRPWCNQHRSPDSERALQSALSCRAAAPCFHSLGSSTVLCHLSFCETRNLWTRPMCIEYKGAIIFSQEGSIVPNCATGLAGSCQSKKASAVLYRENNQGDKLSF